jgi:hypothetical protein
MKPAAYFFIMLLNGSLVLVGWFLLESRTKDVVISDKTKEIEDIKRELRVTGDLYFECHQENSRLRGGRGR